MAATSVGPDVSSGGAWPEVLPGDGEGYGARAGAPPGRQVRLEDEVERIALGLDRLDAALPGRLDRDRGHVPVSGILPSDHINQAVADRHCHPALEPGGEVMEALPWIGGDGARLQQGDDHAVLERVLPPAREARQVGDRVGKHPLHDWSSTAVVPPVSSPVMSCRYREGTGRGWR
jgi:hypothetical protein